jgi:hypothetical protein
MPTLTPKIGITPPFVIDDTSYESPTVTSPFDETNVDKQVILRDAELWAVNRVSGKVYAKSRSGL